MPTKIVAASRVLEATKPMAPWAPCRLTTE